MAEPTPNLTPQNGAEPPAPKPPKTDPSAPSVEEQIKAAVAEEKAKWDKGLDEKIKAAQEEATRLAKLSAEERRKEEDKLASEKLAREQAEFEHKKLVYYAERELVKASLPEEIGEYIAAGDEKTTKEFIDKIKASYDKAVEKAVDEKLKGKPPEVGGKTPSSSGGVSGFMDAIRENQR